MRIKKEMFHDDWGQFLLFRDWVLLPEINWKHRPTKVPSFQTNKFLFGLFWSVYIPRQYSFCSRIKYWFFCPISYQLFINEIVDDGSGRHLCRGVMSESDADHESHLDVSVQQCLNTSSGQYLTHLTCHTPVHLNIYH